MSTLYPPVDPALTPFEAPVTRVTVLEDRAHVRREGRIALAAGRNKLVVHQVSPVLQDVSLQARLLPPEVGRVADVKARRALRIRFEDLPPEAAALETKVDEKIRELNRHREERRQARQRLARVQAIISHAVQEVPTDAAWGRVDPDTWTNTFSTLFARARAALEADLTGFHAQEDLHAEIDNLIKQRLVMNSLDTEIVGWLGVDVEVEAAIDVNLAVEYIVPCALWRPIHTVRWSGDKTIDVSTSAVLWQNTGEDWTDVELHFSTSRASLGHEPPLLTDDPLSAERKDDEISVEIRRVEVEKASVEGAGGGASGDSGRASVELPGVDDGGQRRHIEASGQHSVPADGRPVRVPLSGFAAEAAGTLITMPEEEPAAVWRIVATHCGAQPLLAGPVELVRAHGPVGWTQTRFVAPQSRFELGFGPDESVRVDRTIARKSLDRRSDEWPATRRTVRVFVSNLGIEPRQVKVIERIPVSEVDEVRVTLEADKTTEGHAVDDDGFVTWTIDLEGRAQRELRLVWVLTVAPSLDWEFD